MFWTRIFDSTTPSSRMDDYPYSMLDKFYNMAIQFNNLYGDNFIIALAGDTFHRNQQTILYMNEVITTFRKVLALCKGIFAIVGNHSLAYERLETVMKSPIRTLFEAGCVKPLGLVSLCSLNYSYLDIHGYWYPEECLSLKESSVKFDVSSLGKSHLLAHRFYKTNDPYNLDEGFIKTSGYSAVILGHDHVQYPMENCGKSIIVRPGAFSRGTAHFSNLVRTVNVAVYSIDDASFTYEPVKCKESEYVFSSSAFNKDKKMPATISVLTERILELVDSLEKGDNKGKVYTVLDSIDISPEVKSKIESYLSMEGIYRVNEKGSCL